MVVADVSESTGRSRREAVIVYRAGESRRSRGVTIEGCPNLWGQIRRPLANSTQDWANVSAADRVGRIHFPDHVLPARLLIKDVPFLGSGSTLIAADKTGRTCCGVELDPLYSDVIVPRYEAAAGAPAVLDERARPSRRSRRTGREPASA
jgi:hypothetical protein